MTENSAAAKPILQKPPGYREPSAPPASAAPRPPAPPRKPPQLPPTLRYAGKRPVRRRRTRACCCRLCCWLFLILIALAFVFAVTGALAYLWFQPHLPLFRIQSVRTSRFNVSRSDGASSFDAAVAVTIQAVNPNGKMGLTYSDLEAVVSVADDDGDVDLGTATALGFAQGRRNSTPVRFAVVAKEVVVDESVASRMAARYRSKELSFVVEVRTKVGVRVGGKSTGRVPIRVECGAVSLKQTARVNTENDSTLPRCHINLLRWINLH
ncbi:hypothetical protein J5N97_007661 [Dioscorea zingiberensis]|uniref:Late embryogenesis abundant protein LEA-2 subgroup domain-containing protein n=1 Tax=Dioscorea zingiberensis TaxID=325984 RepID=A0A9D5DEP7_9LILI|nr:hypothetical protein J5N97_007661 [Dioscorea zingiberensis]